jgi:hypothetical protein
MWKRSEESCTIADLRRSALVVSPVAHYRSAVGSGVQNQARQNNSSIMNFEFK